MDDRPMPIPAALGRVPSDASPGALAMPTPSPGSLRPFGRLRLHCIEGARPGVVYDIPESGGQIGRRDAREAILPLCDLSEQEEDAGERSVSRRHAEMSRQGDRFVLVDLDSVNGTTVNGVRLTPGVPVTVEAGDRITFGRIACAVVVDGAP